MSHGVVGPDDAVRVIDQAARGAELHEHAAHLFRGFGIGAFGEQFHAIRRRPFDDAQERGPLGLATVESVARNFRDPIERAITIHIRAATRRRTGARCRWCPTQPASGASVVTVEMSLFVRYRAEDAERVIQEGATADEGELGVVLPGEIAVDHLGRAGEVGLGAIQRSASDHAYRAADAAFGHLRCGRFEYFQARDELDRQIAEVDIASATDREREGGNAIDLDAIQSRLGATDADTSAFAVRPADLHAGNALERFAQILVRKVADVLGGDRIHHLDRLALDLEGRAQAGADAGDDNFFELAVFGADCWCGPSM